jgi:hypothetical protein
MTPTISGAVSGSVRIWLRLEGLAAATAAVYLYARGGHSWILFAALFLAPDLSFAAYLAGPRVGAAAYNALHSYLGPLALAVGLLAAGASPALALIWAAHIGFDRTLGYGLKYPTNFGDAHLGTIGRRAAESRGAT